MITLKDVKEKFPSDEMLFNKLLDDISGMINAAVDYGYRQITIFLDPQNSKINEKILSTIKENGFTISQPENLHDFGSLKNTYYISGW